MPHVLATHTDSPEVFIWNTEAQPDRQKLVPDMVASVPELTYACVLAMRAFAVTHARVAAGSGDTPTPRITRLPSRRRT